MASCGALPGAGSLICTEKSHPGEWHYDGIDDITWSQGRHLPEAALRGEDGQEGGDLWVTQP